MKKILLMLCAALACVCLVGCSLGGDDGNNEAAPVDNSPEGILSSMQSDTDSTISDIKSKFEETKSSIGGSYDGYISNKQTLTDWYEYVNSKMGELNGRLNSNSINYFKAVSSSVSHEDEDSLEDALDDYYDTVYDDIYEKIFDSIYDEAYMDAFDTYYDGIVKDGYDLAAYKEWNDVSSECYKTWSDYRSDNYDAWSDARGDLYDYWFDINSAFLYDKEYNVDEILDLNK